MPFLFYLNEKDNNIKKRISKGGEYLGATESLLAII